MKSALTVNSLVVRYGDALALTDVSLVVPTGQCTTLIGANGAGKSTVLRSIMGLERPSSGRIWLGDQEITSWRPQEVVRKGVVLVPEGRQLFGDRTVLDNLHLGAYSLKGVRGVSVGSRVEEVLEIFPALRDRLSETAGALSGGQQQMVAIARGLMPRPRVLLLDEPSLGLSPLMCETIFNSISRLTSSGITVLLVEQNARASLNSSQSAYVLERGRVVLSGTSTSLLDSEEVQEHYLGITDGEARRLPQPDLARVDRLRRLVRSPT